MANCERFEKEVRCHGCDKFLTRVIVLVMPDKEGVTVKDFGFNIQFGTETKCRRCKSLNYDMVTV